MPPLVVKNIVLHCSDTDDGPTLSWPAIKRFHMAPPPDGRGWLDIGYHFGLEEWQGGFVMVPGRSPLVRGAHCEAQGRNRDSLGVCVVGKFDDQPPAAIVMRCTVDALAMLCFAFAVPADHVYGHREFEPGKTCPGTKWDLDATRAAVAARLRDTAPIGRHLRMDLTTLP